MKQSTKDKVTKLIFVTNDVYDQCMSMAEKSRGVTEVETLYLINAWNASQDRDKYISKLKELSCP